MKPLILFGGIVVGVLIRKVEKRLNIEPGLLLTIYLVSVLVYVTLVGG